MPSYKQTLKQTYFPVQEAAAAWTAAKASAGAEFSAVEAERKAVDEVRLRRQQYADNIRPREGSSDAFMFQSLQAQASAAPPGGEGDKAAEKARKAVDEGIAGIRALPGSTVFKAGDANDLLVRSTFEKARSVEEKQRVIDAAKARGYQGDLVIPAGTLSAKAIQKKALEGDAAAQAQYLDLVGRPQALLDLADNLGPRAFQGGLKGREFYENLTSDQQELARVYASALLDDGVVTEDEIPADRIAEARKLHGEIEAKGAYRRSDNKAFDPGYLELLKDLKVKESRLAEAEARVKGKTVEGLSLELYRKMQGEEGQVDIMTGLPIQVASTVPPLLRSLQGDIASILQAHEASGSDSLAVPQTKAVQAALKLKAGGMSAKAISAEMSKAGLPAADIRQALAFIAADDIVRSYSANVAPGTDPKVIGEIGATDAKAAQKAERDRIEEARRAALQAERAATRAAGQDNVRQAERQRLSKSGLVRDRLKAKFGRTFQEAIELPPTVPTVPTVAPEPRLSDEEVERRIEASLAAEAAAAAPSPTPTSEPVRFEMVLDPVTGEYVRKQVGG